MTHICFYYPSRNIGGAQLLFCRVGLELLNNFSNDFLITYIDYEDGYYKTFFKDKKVNVNFIDYVDNTSVNLVKVSTIITPLSYIYKLNNFKFKEKIKIFFWDLHTFNLIATSDFYPILYRFLKTETIQEIYPYINCFRRKKIYNFLNYVIDKKGVSFMCDSTLKFNKKIFKFTAEANHLPIFLSERINKKTQYNTQQKSINFCWLGRIDEDKYQLLNSFIKDLSLLNVNVILHVIGDGTKINNVINYSKKYFKEENCIFTGVLQEEELQNYLTEKIDILFGVGTSVLEGGALGIPSVFGVTPDYRGSVTSYTWMKDNQGYNVFSDYPSKNIEKIIEDYFKCKKIIGDDCYAYFINNHSTTSVIQLLKERIENNNLLLKDYLKLELHKLSMLEKVVKFIKVKIKSFLK